MKRALITGVGGQDGSYLAEHLVGLGYEVFGTLRMADMFQRNLDTVFGVSYEYADLRDEVSLEKVIRRVNPDEIYNLAAQSFVPPSWTQPAETFDVNVGGLARILKILENIKSKAKVYQASTSEMYGNVMMKQRSLGLSLSVDILHIDETVRMYPVSPYGVAKLAAHKLVNTYRQKGMFVVSGILFNHESPRRGEEMVTRKITRHVARWMAGDMAELRLGNPDSRRDWGFAGDYVKAMHLMLQRDQPEDFVIGYGEAHSVKQFLHEAVARAGLYGRDLPVTFNAPEFTRAAELHCLVADYGKARNIMGWQPETTFSQLVGLMVKHDHERLTESKQVAVTA